MRVIAGKYRGRSLKALAGTTTRPTTDRVKEAWASTLEAMLDAGFDGTRVLDGFAGSGGLGLEALSRGAAHCVFSEKDMGAYRVLSKNIAGLGLAEQEFRTLRLDVLSAAFTAALKHGGTTFDLVILDPPYNISSGRIERFLKTLADGGFLAKDCSISYEYGTDPQNASEPSAVFSVLTKWPFEHLATKTYGNTKISYLRYH